MRKQIDNLLTEDITKLKRCHIYNGNTLSDVKVSFQDIKGMRKSLRRCTRAELIRPSWRECSFSIYYLGTVYVRHNCFR